MNINPIDRLPDDKFRRNRESNNRMKELLLEFYDSEDEYAEITFDHGEYSNSSSLFSSVRQAIKSLDIPLEAVTIRGGVFVRRCD